MQINKNYETKIAIKDLFFELLYKWRSILLAALIGAILVGAFQYYSVYRVHSKGEQTKDEKQYEIDLENYRDSVRNLRSSIRTYTNLIREKSDYLDQSVYMSLDSQNEWVAYKRFYVRMDQAVLDALPAGMEEDPADHVAMIYASTLTSNLDAAEMEALLGTDELEYINELVELERDDKSNTFCVRVLGADEETVRGQLDYFMNRLETVCQPMAQEVGAHALVLVDEDVFSQTDDKLSSKQDEINRQVEEWQTALKEQREKLNNLEEDGEPVKPGNHVKKFAVIGFILGALLLAVIYIVRYVLGGKLHAGRELNEKYNLPVLGEYAGSRARRSGKGLDGLFEKWEFAHAVTDPATVSNGIAALLADRLAGKKLLLTGTVSQEALDALCADLDKRLSGACALTAQGGMPVNTDAIAAVRDVDAVILVEKKYASRNADIQRSAELLKIGEADVNGCIVL